MFSFKKDHIKIATKKFKNAPTVFHPKKYKKKPGDFVFLRGKTVGTFFEFFRWIFVFSRVDFNIILFIKD